MLRKSIITIIIISMVLCAGLVVNKVIEINDPEQYNVYKGDIGIIYNQDINQNKVFDISKNEIYLVSFEDFKKENNIKLEDYELSDNIERTLFYIIDKEDTYETIVTDLYGNVADYFVKSKTEEGRLSINNRVSFNFKIDENYKSKFNNKVVYRIENPEIESSKMEYKYLFVDNNEFGENYVTKSFCHNCSLLLLESDWIYDINKYYIYFLDIMSEESNIYSVVGGELLSNNVMKSNISQSYKNLNVDAFNVFVEKLKEVNNAVLDTKSELRSMVYSQIIGFVLFVFFNIVFLNFTFSFTRDLKNRFIVDKEKLIKSEIVKNESSEMAVSPELLKIKKLEVKHRY